MPLGRLGSYDLLERIGEGGMGVVFRARDSRLDRPVAVKVLTERLALDEHSRARLLREARAEARLNHPNIATCYDVGEANPEPADLLSPGTPGPHPAPVLFLAMELVPGVDLGELIGDEPLPLARVLDLGVQISAGLEAAHRSGVVHRDLKPGNVRVTPEGRAKILDFGLARHFAAPTSDSAGSTQSTSSRTSGAIVGTVQYMSPEQAAGQAVDARSDLFSLGVLLYELVTGRRPFAGDDMVTTFYALANVPPPPLARFAGGVPDELERIVAKLLEKNPAERYQSAHEVRTDLEHLQRVLAPPGAGVRPPTSRPRVPRRWIVMVGIAAAAALVVGWLDWTSSRTRGTPSVAILGIENATGDSTLDFLCAGLATDLESDFVQGSGVNVSSVAEVRKLRAEQRAPREAARRLGVRAVLIGVLRRMAAKPRLQVELVDGRSGYVSWSAAYDLEPEHALLVKHEIATAVTASLVAKRPTRGARGHGGPTPPAAAYEEYLRGVEALTDLDDPLAPRRAAAALDRAVALAPDFALAWAARSRALAWRYEHERDEPLIVAAENSADRALGLDPVLVPARVARARVYQATGRLPQAIADLDSVLRVNPNWDDAWRMLARACRQAGDLARAEASLRQAVTLRPGYAANWQQLGALMLRLGRTDDARAAYRRVIELEPDQNLGYAGLASVETSAGRFGEAAEIYRKLPRDVTDAALASNMASAYFFAGRLDEALRSYLLAIQIEPRNATMRGNLGDCYQRLRRPDDARAQYREAARLDEADLRISPDDANLLTQQVLHLAKAGECERAWATYAEHRVELAGREATIQHDLAKAFALCGRRDEAVAALRRMAAQGATTDLLRSEDEFASLRGDSAFRALLPAPGR